MRSAQAGGETGAEEVQAVASLGILRLSARLFKRLEEKQV